MIVLQRSAYGRIAGGARLQPLLAFVVLLLAARIVGLAGGLIHDHSAPLVETTLVFAVLLALLLAGATGWAAADEQGVRWRFYAPHAYGWDEIEQVRLDVSSAGVGGVLHQVVVRVRGHDHRVIPAHTSGSGREPFGRALIALAARHGIDVEDGWSRR